MKVLCIAISFLPVDVSLSQIEVFVLVKKICYEARAGMSQSFFKYSEFDYTCRHFLHK